MKQNKFLLFSLLLGVFIFALVSCSKKDGSDIASKDSDVDYYTCAMHPSVKSQDPKAKCPICSMDLVPVKKKNEATDKEIKDIHSKSDGVDYYTCAMHPSVKSKDPKAKCPICSMDLEPVMKKSSKDIQTGLQTQDPAQLENSQGTQETKEEKPTEFMVPVERQQMIGVTYAKVERKPLHHTVRSVGMVSVDKQKHWDAVARVDGYIDRLFVSSPGQIVEKNQPLLSIYSPDILTTQREFVSLLKMKDDAHESHAESLIKSSNRLLEAAKQRLKLWNVTDDQIVELEQSRQPTEKITLFSPFKGVVQDIPVDQGRKVMSGDHLVDIADLSTVWVWAEFYQDELPMLKEGLSTTVTTSSYPGEVFKGVISSIDPFMNENTRTGKVRLDTENPEFKLRPSMYVDVELSMDMGEGLTIPVNAVLPTGKRNVVFINKGEGKLEPRFVELGPKYGDYYAVLKGLTEGEQVVNSANFLIDAESKVQGALKSW